MNSSYQPSSYQSNADHVEQTGQVMRKHTLTSDNDVPNAVRNLLMSTKRLQDVLKLWSVDKATENDVSDLYVEIGHEFNATITAFSLYHIDLSDIHDVPSQLRSVLEQCLAEDPTTEVLERFMPDVRRVIFKLLKGLQSRQEQWQAVARPFGGSDASAVDLP